ncbi:hypothetical protein BD408DRAFT_177386 [Parasitella parasitica]|nr:hypothetical protein BD408DRAFT_177386 [Parasitella parasitica]
MKREDENTHANEPTKAIEKIVNDHQAAEATNASGKSNDLPKTRRSDFKKNTKSISTGESNELDPQQPETAAIKEKPKKKRNKKSRKKVNDEEDKENIAPQSEVSKSNSMLKGTSICNAENKGMRDADNEPVDQSSKKGNGKKKHTSLREPLSEVVSKELGQGDYSIDYKGLHDAL